MAMEQTQKLDELVKTFDTAMLVTQSLHGDLRARPMAIAEYGGTGALYFVTRADDEKLEEVLQAPGVAVTMQHDGCHLSISGKAKISTDKALAGRLWSASMRLWFPGGVDDPEMTVIMVDPDWAEYWDRTGMRRMEFLWEAGKALLRGEKARDDKLGGHAKVRL
jgi:general stress protein 26